MKLIDQLAADAERIAEEALPGLSELPGRFVALVHRLEQAVPQLIEDTLAPAEPAPAAPAAPADPAAPIEGEQEPPADTTIASSAPPAPAAAPEVGEPTPEENAATIERVTRENQELKAQLAQSEASRDPVGT